MGITCTQGTVRGPDGEEEFVRFLVESGATYSLVPKSAWEAIGLVPKREMTLTLADGTMVRRRISECYLVLPQGDGHTPVILGEPEDEAF